MLYLLYSVHHNICLLNISILIYLFSVNFFWVLITNTCTMYRHAKLHYIYINYMYTNNSHDVVQHKVPTGILFKHQIFSGWKYMYIFLKYLKSCLFVQANIWDKIYTCTGMYQVLIFDTQSRCLVICFNCLCFACLFWF